MTFRVSGVRLFINTHSQICQPCIALRYLVKMNVPTLKALDLLFQLLLMEKMPVDVASEHSGTLLIAHRIVKVSTPTTFFPTIYLGKKYNIILGTL